MPYSPYALRGGTQNYLHPDRRSQFPREPGTRKFIQKFESPRHSTPIHRNKLRKIVIFIKLALSNGIGMDLISRRAALAIAALRICLSHRSDKLAKR